MRTDTVSFTEQNGALAKSPRYTIELAFDSANTILWYFTSHADAATPAGASVISGVIEAITGTSQRLEPDKAVSTIGAISFKLVDFAGSVTAQLGAQLALGRSTRQQRVRVYVGFEGIAWEDYTLVATQLVESIDYHEGVYNFSCADIQRAMRKEIFDAAVTNLAASITATDTTIQVYDTSAFQMVTHGTSYSDAPNQTVGYIKIDDEIIRYTGKTATSFTGCMRGVLNTLAAAHSISPDQSADRQPKVEEYIYLEIPAVKLAYALLTGTLYGQGGATLPDLWHLGIPPIYVRENDFTAIGTDLWDTADDEAGFIVRFEGLARTDGKQFIEKELLLLLGCFMPVYTDGALGLKRMAPVLAGAGYVTMLDESNVVSHGSLTHDFKALHNIIQIEWNYVPSQERFTRTTILADAKSYGTHGKAEPYKLSFRGLHGSRHSNTILNTRFESIRDRYTGPPLRLTVKCLPSMNGLEVGDVVRVKLSSIRDFVANDTLDRSFEIQQVQVDWISGDVSLTLFASSQAPEALPPIFDTCLIAQSWYEAQGTNLASVLTITGADPWHVSANGNLPSGDYYFIGDLIIDDGVTVTINQNVRLFVMGHLTINGVIDGKGRGHPGAPLLTPPAYPAYPFVFTPGTPGFLGATQAGGPIIYTNTDCIEYILDIGVLNSLPPAPVTKGLNAVVPSSNLEWKNTDLTGLFTDLRGSSGGTGGIAEMAAGSCGNMYVYRYKGGAGGAGGAGLVTVTRGVSFGVSGKIDISGMDGGIGETFNLGSKVFHAGSGGGGTPGGWQCVLDGANANIPDLSGTFVAEYGNTPITGVPLSSKTSIFYKLPPQKDIYSHYVGTGDGTTFPKPSGSGAGSAHVKIQFAPCFEVAEPDPPPQILAPPANLTLISGLNTYLINPDGSVTPRIKATWTASPDARVIGYIIRYGVSGSAETTTLPPIFGRTTESAYILPVTMGESYDVEVRAIDAAYLASAPAMVLDHVVTVVPSETRQVLVEREEEPDWLATRTNFYHHWTGLLVPKNTLQASAIAKAELFEIFVHSPERYCTYQLPEIDLGADANVRVYADIAGALGRGRVGIFTPQLILDWRTQSGVYGGLRPWAGGYVRARYIKAGVLLDTYPGVGYLSGFRLIIDTDT